MAKEIKIDHKDIMDPQTITDINEALFEANDMDMHVNEMVKFEDDHKKGVRHITVKNTKYFNVPEVPWLKKKKSE